MVGLTHEDVDQGFSWISVHLTGKAIPTLPVLQDLMRDAYHPTPMVQHLDGLWNYRELGMISAATLQGHSGPHLFRLKEAEGAVQIVYNQQWCKLAVAIPECTLQCARYNPAGCCLKQRSRSSPHSEWQGEQKSGLYGKRFKEMAGRRETDRTRCRVVENTH